MSEVFGHLLDVTLDLTAEAGDSLVDLLRRLLGLLCKFAHLVGDYCKAASRFASADGPEGGVEREQVGLVGDPRDCLDDVADVGSLTLEFANHLDRGNLSPCGDTDVAHRDGDVSLHAACD
jgi:hypothetical protein